MLFPVVKFPTGISAFFPVASKVKVVGIPLAREPVWNAFAHCNGINSKAMTKTVKENLFGFLIILTNIPSDIERLLRKPVFYFFSRSSSGPLVKKH